MRFAYYPGCSPQSTTKELDVTTRSTAEALGIDLVDLEGLACCGSVELRLNNEELFYAINARSLAMAERQGLNFLTICNTCQLTLCQANRKLKNDSALLDKINGILKEANLEYRGGVEIRHYLWVLMEDLGPEKLKERIQRPLSGLKIAPFYGCHLLRPLEDLGFDDPDDPSSLEDFITICGGEPVNYEGKIKCCGFHNLPYDQDLAVSLTGKFLKQAKDAGADCMVTPCPLCFTMLDGYQQEAERALNAKIDLPVFHLPQLIGLAMGMEGDDILLRRSMVQPFRILERIKSA